MAKATRRRFFALAAAPAAAALPAIAAPVVEMHEADVMPLITIRRPMHEQLYNYRRAVSIERVELEPRAPFTIKVGDRVVINGRPWDIIGSVTSDG